MSNQDRYSRQVLFDGIGRDGQQRIRESRVVVIGCGALGSMQIEMLARAGVGHLRVIDRDFIEESNLHRQVMFTEQDATERLPKAVACRQRVSAINSDIEIEAIVRDVNYTNIEQLIADAALVLDGTDNFETRYLINDACVKHRIPWIYGAAVGADGLTMTILPGLTPCLRCVFAESPQPGTFPTCDTSGVILPIIAQIASIQVTEALKIITGQVAALHGQLIQVDLWRNRFSRVRLEGMLEQSDCPACRHHEFPFLKAKSGQLVSSLCGRNSVQISQAKPGQIDLKELAERIGAAGEVTVNKYLLRCRLGEYELTVFPDARGIIKGTDDITVARSLYAKYVGA